MNAVSSAVHTILDSAKQGKFDLSVGEKQLKVAVIRLSEDPEFVCEPGSVVRGNLCGKFFKG